MKLEAFIAQDVCGNTKSEPFPIVREVDSDPANHFRVDFYLRHPVNDGVIKIVESVNFAEVQRPVVEAGNDLAKDVQLYFDALAGRNTEIEPAWQLEQVAKSLKIYQTEQASSPIKNGKTDFSFAAIR